MSLGGFADYSQLQALPFSTDHHAKLASVHLHYCTTQLFRATVEDAVKGFVSSY